MNPRTVRKSRIRLRRYVDPEAQGSHDAFDQMQDGNTDGDPHPLDIPFITEWPSRLRSSENVQRPIGLAGRSL